MKKLIEYKRVDITKHPEYYGTLKENADGDWVILPAETADDIDAERAAANAVVEAADEYRQADAIACSLISNPRSGEYETAARERDTAFAKLIAALDALEKKPESMDWEKAEEHLKRTEEAYKELVGMPQCNPGFAIAMLAGIRQRFETGDRSQGLYDEIMLLE